MEDELRERLSALEAENASLVAAAEEAAALVEHYAAAHAESGQAAERAARRAARMDAQAEADALAIDKYRRVVRAGEMVEQVLREQIAVASAHKAPACCCMVSRNDACEPVSEALDAVLKKVAPSVANAAKTLIAIEAAVKYLKHVRGNATAEAINVLYAVHAHIITNVDVSSDALIATQRLAQQARCFAAALKWGYTPSELHEALLRLASAQLRACVPQEFLMDAVDTFSPRSLAEEIMALVDACAPVLVNDVQPLSHDCGDIATAATARVTELETELSARERELDDVKVRASVFEQRLTLAKRTEADAASLRDALASRDSDLLELRAEFAQSVEKARVADAALAAATAEAAKPIVKAPRVDEAGDILRRAEMDSGARQRVLRMEYARHLLADLDSSTECDIARGQVLATRDVARDVLRICRRTAARARVVKLDANTLTPKDAGATLSRAAVESAAGVAASMLGGTRKTKPARTVHVSGASADAIARLTQTLMT